MSEFQWNIFWAYLDPARGSEKSGIRPVIIVSSEEINTRLQLVGVVPLASMKKGRNIYSTEVFLPKKETGLDRDSISMSHQLRVLSKNRLGKKCGEIKTIEVMEEIKQSIKVFLDME
jgi:mRNA interferase MazF